MTGVRRSGSACGCYNTQRSVHVVTTTPIHPGVGGVISARNYQWWQWETVRGRACWRVSVAARVWDPAAYAWWQLVVPVAGILPRVFWSALGHAFVWLNC